MRRSGEADLGEKPVAVITGAANGIGRATALELGRAGYALALCDVDASGLEQAAAAAGAELTRVVDVSRADQLAELAEACREQFGHVDVLVNNAGILRLGAWEDVSEADWRKLFEINLLGVSLATQAFRPLLASSRGHVVNLGSGSSLLPFPGYAAYGSLKVGVLWLCEYLHAELRPLGIAVSCVCPLLVRTHMGDAGQAGVTRQPEWLFHPPEKVARLVRRTVKSRRFLVYGHPLLHALHLLYRWTPGLARAILTSATRRQQEERASSTERDA
jgi:NAD(P)-dependent dehydrogenase (short-subunit alcohol dehydrogenase family)